FDSNPSVGSVPSARIGLLSLTPCTGSAIVWINCCVDGLYSSRKIGFPVLVSGFVPSPTRSTTMSPGWNAASSSRRSRSSAIQYPGRERNEARDRRGRRPRSVECRVTGISPEGPDPDETLDRSANLDRLEQLSRLQNMVGNDSLCAV